MTESFYLNAIANTIVPMSEWNCNNINNNNNDNDLNNKNNNNKNRIIS